MLSSLYDVWRKMIYRCHDRRSRDFPQYGDKGISVCTEWLTSFENFKTDMGPRPPKTTIERIDNNKGYYKSNCRWATRYEQSKNRKTTLQNVPQSSFPYVTYRKDGSKWRALIQSRRYRTLGASSKSLGQYQTEEKAIQAVIFYFLFRQKQEEKANATM